MGAALTMSKRFARASHNGVLPKAAAVNVIRKKRPIPADGRPKIMATQPVMPQMPDDIPRPEKRVLPWDMLLVWKVVLFVRAAALLYPKVRSFTVAHGRGFVTDQIYQGRRTKCQGCPGRVNRVGKAPVGSESSYCRAKGGCGCGHYALARLEWKLRLWQWRCPMQRFGYGSEER